MTEQEWLQIRNEVTAGIAEVGFTALLERRAAALGAGQRTPWDDPPTEPQEPDMSPITVIDDNVEEKDATGARTGVRRRVLTVAAAGPAPRKADRVHLPDGPHEIETVMPTQPGGVALLYELVLAQ